MEAGLRRAGSLNLDGFKQAIASTMSEEDIEAITPKALDIICTCAYSRRSELKKIMTDLVFKQTQDTSLLDYNYNIEQVIWADSCKRVAEAILVLELFLQTYPEVEQPIQIESKCIKRVVIEMNVEEAREFVGRLNAIEKEIVTASQGTP